VAGKFWVDPLVPVVLPVLEPVVLPVLVPVVEVPVLVLVPVPELELGPLVVPVVVDDVPVVVLLDALLVVDEPELQAERRKATANPRPIRMVRRLPPIALPDLVDPPP
jgi:hypothetical protein